MVYRASLKLKGGMESVEPDVMLSLSADSPHHKREGLYQAWLERRDSASSPEESPHERALSIARQATF